MSWNGTWDATSSTGPAAGWFPPKKGEEFLRYAKAILVQEEQIEALCVKNSEKALEVNLCVPRATYISYAFSEFL